MDLTPRRAAQLPDASPELAALDAENDAIDDVSVDGNAPDIFAQEREREKDREALDALRLELADERRRRRDAAQREATLTANAAEAEKRATEARDAKAALEQKTADLEQESVAASSRVLDLEAALEAASLRADAPRSDESGAAGELAQLHSKVEQMIAAWNRERAELTARIDDLTNAGRETIKYVAANSVYEAQIASTAAEHDSLRARVAEFEARDPGAAIDAASVQENAAHLQTKVERLEDELAEARAQLEEYAQAEQRGAAARASAEERLHADLQRAAERERAAKDAAADAHARADALQAAVEESNAALERERSELESLRTERLGGAVAVPHTSPVPSEAPGPAADELQTRIAALERENATQRDQFHRDIGELEALVEARIFKEEELENEMERLRAERDEARAGR